MSNKPDSIVGYWASQEQYSMQDLLKFVTEAKHGGFKTCLTSDHFHPWWHDNGYGNFTWIWLAAAAERTKKMEFVTGVTAAVYRRKKRLTAKIHGCFTIAGQRFDIRHFILSCRLSTSRCIKHSKYFKQHSNVYQI